MPQGMVVLGLTFDIIGVLLLSAGFITGRKQEILRRVKSMEQSEELRAKLVNDYENIGDTFRHNYEQGIIDSSEKLENAERTVDEWIEDVNRSRSQLSKNISNDLESLRAELESFQLTKEAAGVVCLVVGFLLQIVGTISVGN